MFGAAPLLAQGRTAVDAAALPEDWQGSGGVAVVVSDETGSPLPEVNVVLRLEAAAGTAGSLLLRTDEAGRAEVSGLALGEWQVELRREGYMLYSAFLRLDAKKDPKVGFASRQRTGTYWAPLNAVFLPRGLPVTTGLKTGRDTPKEARREARRIAKESRREADRLARRQRRGDLARVVEEAPSESIAGESPVADAPVQAASSQASSESLSEASPEASTAASSESPDRLAPSIAEDPRVPEVSEASEISEGSEGSRASTDTDLLERSGASEATVPRTVQAPSEDRTAARGAAPAPDTAVELSSAGGMPTSARDRSTATMPATEPGVASADPPEDGARGDRFSAGSSEPFTVLEPPQAAVAAPDPVAVREPEGAEGGAARVASVDRRRAAQEAKERARAERRRRRGLQALIVDDDPVSSAPSAPRTPPSPTEEPVQTEQPAQTEELVLVASGTDDASSIRVPRRSDSEDSEDSGASENSGNSGGAETTALSDEEEVVLVASGSGRSRPSKPGEAGVSETAAVAEATSPAEAGMDTSARPMTTTSLEEDREAALRAADQVPIRPQRRTPPVRLLPNPRLRPAGACPECRPGEFSITTELSLSSGADSGPCSRQLGEPLVAYAPRMPEVLTGEQSAYVGGLIEDDFNDLRRLLPEAERELLENAVAGAAPVDSSCRTLAIVLPEGALYIGFRYQMGEEGTLGECLLGQECQVEKGEWFDAPTVTATDSVTLVHAVASNRARRARTARLTVYFRPGEGWLPAN